MTPFRDSHQDLLRALASFPGAEGDTFQATLHAELLTPFLSEAQGLLSLGEAAEQQLQAAVRSLEEIVDRHIYRIEQ